MKASVLAVCAALIAWAGAPDVGAAQASQYRLDEGGVVRFIARGPAVTRPAKGRFSFVGSRLTVDPRDLSTATGSVEVLLTSITTDESGWDAMFRRAPFLSIDQHPRASFVLQQVRDATALVPDRWTRLRLVGRFTLHSVTRDATIWARVRWVPATEEGATDRIEVEGTFRFYYEDHDIAIPRGHTETLAGDAARVFLELSYRPQPAANAP